MEDGTMSDSPKQVSDAFLGYYKKLLGTRNRCSPIDASIVRHGPLLSRDLAHDLIKSVTDLEIKNALMCIGNDKSPGPDGYNSLFFKKSWNIIGTSVLAAVKEFFSSGQLLKQLNHTNLALIPKSSHANEVTDYRPIACCNIIYKIISKILASRLAPVLGKIIDKAQSAFVEGRSISDNIHLAEALLRHYQRARTPPKCLLKVDLRKAFDSVDWIFLFDLLTELNSPHNLFTGS